VFTGAVTWDDTAADGSVTIKDGNKNVIFTLGPDGSVTAGAGLPGAMQADAVGWFGQADLATRGGVLGVGVPGQQFRIVTALNGPNGGPALNFVPREILYTEITGANAAARVTKTQKAGAAPGATLAEESAAIKARGLRGTPTAPLTGSDYARQKTALAEESAAIKARGLRTWDTRAEETNAIEARVELSYINPLTGFNLRPNPAVEGILSIGSAIVNLISPPTWLPPVYVAPSSLTPIKQYVPPSSLTLTPVRTVTPPYVAPSSLTQLPKPKAPPYVPPSSLTQPPKPKAPPYVPPSSLTQPPKPKAPVAPTAGSPGRPGAGR
jgi:hypothetical protein